MSSRRTGLVAWWISLCSLVFLVTATLDAQPPEKQPPEKQPPAKQPPQKPNRTEEEEETKPATPPAKTAPPKAERKEPEKPVAPPRALKPPPQVLPLGTGPFDLVEEAKKATNPEVKKFLEELSQTSDEVVSDSGKVYRISPIAKRFDRNDTRPLTVKPVTGDTMTFQANQIRAVTHYEQRVLDRVRTFLDRRLDSGENKVSRFNQLRAAEMALTEGLKYHQGALSQNVRDKATWAGMTDELKSALFHVRIDEIRALSAEGQIATGEVLAHKLFSEAPGDRVLLDAIEQFYVKQADEFLDQNNYLETRLKMEYLRDKFRHGLSTQLTRRVIGRLEDHARKHFDLARQAVEAKDRSKALTALEEAEQAWPTLPGLREYRVRTVGEYTVLRVGVRNLPSMLSPITAITDADKIACRLVYEPLVSSRYAPSAAEGYSPGISDMPHRISRGYEFNIPAYLKWSDGTPVKTDDVMRSFEFVGKPGSPLYDPTYDNDGVFVLNQVDESKFTVTFRNAVVDPLSHLGFYLLPSSRLPRDQSTTAAALAFAKNPMGTGPYLYAGREDEEVIFKVNPHYKRPHLPEGPAIREIRFIKYGDFDVAKRAYLDGRWQMLLDATSKEIDELAGNPQSLVFTPTEARTSGTQVMTNPRIYFLGFNYRKAHFNSAKADGTNDARKAVYHGVNRDEILNKLFRGKMGAYHQTLNGPFPVNSWGYDSTSYGQSPYNTVQANVSARSSRLPELKLIVLAEDETGVKACEMIAADLAKANVKVKVTPLPANSFYVELNKPEPDYDLVYTCFDFDSESLNVRSLFDPAGVGGQGRNFMSYQRQTPNAELMRAINEAIFTRDMKNAERKMYSVHKQVIDKTLIVPLYQLDRHVAVHRSLDKYPRFHPVYVFEGVENWVLRVGGM